jgi:translation elongation factor EF-4
MKVKHIQTLSIARKIQKLEKFSNFSPAVDMTAQQKVIANIIQVLQKQRSTRVCFTTKANATVSLSYQIPPQT